MAFIENIEQHTLILTVIIRKMIIELISILEWFLMGNVTLKTGVIAAENSQE